MSRRALLLSLLALLAIAGCKHATATPKLHALDARFEPLREQFNADSSHVRVLALLSPT